MVKKLLVIPFVVALLSVAPVSVNAVSGVEIIDVSIQDINISVKASKIHVTGGSGEMMHIYNVAGVRVLSVKVDSQDWYYDLNLSKGCYIVKVGRTTRKISIK